MASRSAREGPKVTASPSLITKRNGARQTLPESEDRYRALFDRSLDAVYIHDFEGNFLDANDAALRLLGYSRDEILGLSFADLLDASQLPTALTVLQEIMESGYQAKPTMFKLKRKDGTLVEVETVAAVITNGGQSVAIQGIARDITERRRMEERLQEAKEELEDRVAERTAELEDLNAELHREITEHEQTEEALRESEERYRTLYTKTPVMVYSIDTDGNIVTVSDRWLELLGYKRNEVIGRKSTGFLTAESRQYAETVALPKFWKTGWARDVAYQFVKKNGEIVDVLLSAIVQRDLEGNIVRSLAVLDDITTRKRAEEALRKSEETFRTLYTKTPAMVHSIDTDGNIVTVSDRWLKVLGYERNEVIGRKSTEFLTAESRQYAETVTLPEFWKTGRARDLAFQFVKKNGEIVDVLLSAVLERDLEGNAVRTLAVLDDITTRKRAEEALRESEQKFRTLAENSTEVIWLLDTENCQVLYVNPAYEELWGLTCQSLYDEPRSCLRSIHPEDRERVIAVLDIQAETGTYNEEYRIIRPDGSIRWIWDRGFAVRDESGKVYREVGLAADITERKLLEEQLQQARDDLEGRVEREMRKKNPHGLTFREFTILHHIAAGKADKAIAQELGISPLTVHKHVANILSKMNAASRTEAGVRALREGLLD